MSRWLFFSAPGVESARWARAFPSAEFGCDPSAVNAVEPADLCWIMSSLPGWVEHTERFSRQGAFVVVMTLVESREELLTMLRAGGRGYIHALASPENLASVATSVMHGGYWLGSALIGELVASVGNLVESEGVPRSPRQLIGFKSLTAREREVCALVAKGLSNKEVAREFSISERTVKAHLSAVFEKLEIRDRLQLALLVKSHGHLLCDKSRQG
ncbi:MAG: response regulator transcription factor [Oceanicaulis sp.]|nr:response regulator transcription factor [Oceanicaulis sp.]